ncbi:hypothetical protein F8388_026797 [Cannabis sativa]|uniref:Uncharacterized protein n=1 Tax=Cannabis sativa TaxID=3483 RepID=A0A7J6H2G5_CANSA|nr:hypothetical protein F8388_026797 [Cannabis sativa]
MLKYSLKDKVKVTISNRMQGYIKCSEIHSRRSHELKKVLKKFNNDQVGDVTQQHEIALSKIHQIELDLQLNPSSLQLLQEEKIAKEILQEEFSGHGVTFQGIGDNCVAQMALENGSTSIVMLTSGLITSYKAVMWHGGTDEMLHSSVFRRKKALLLFSEVFLWSWISSLSMPILGLQLTGH